MGRPYHVFALLPAETFVLFGRTLRGAGVEYARHAHREWAVLFTLPFAAGLLAAGFLAARLVAARLVADCVFVFIPLSHPLPRPRHLIH